MKYVKKFDLYNENYTIQAKSFKEEFFKLYPKIETKIYFTDNKFTYKLELFNVKINADINYDLIFNAENNSKVIIKNPFYISDVDSLKISIFPIEITPKSAELLVEMFKIGDNLF